MTSPNPDHPDPLTKIAIKCGTDKWGAHFYTPIYHELFAHLRNHPIRLLEIGVGGYEYSSVGGQSLAMWAEYFPQAQITGLDLHEKRLDLPPQVKIYRGSQDDPKLLQKLSDERGPFDIVIDDGSHMQKHVMASFRALFPRLASPGWYVVEDVQTAYFPSFGGSPTQGSELTRLAMNLINFVNHAEIAVVAPQTPAPAIAKQVRSVRAWHNIIAIEKGENDAPSNMKFNLKNPTVQRAMATTEKVLNGVMLPEPLSIEVEMHMRAGDFETAWQLVCSGLARWPKNPALLAQAFIAAQRRSDADGARDMMEQMLSIDMNSGSLRPKLEASIRKIKNRASH